MLKQYLSYQSTRIRNDLKNEIEEKDVPNRDKIKEYYDALSEERGGKDEGSDSSSHDGMEDIDMEVDEIRKELEEGRGDSDMEDDEDVKASNATQKSKGRITRKRSLSKPRISKKRTVSENEDDDHHDKGDNDENGTPMPKTKRRRYVVEDEDAEGSDTQSDAPPKVVKKTSNSQPKVAKKTSNSLPKVTKKTPDAPPKAVKKTSDTLPKIAKKTSDALPKIAKESQLKASNANKSNADEKPRISKTTQGVVDSKRLKDTGKTNEEEDSQEDVEEDGDENDEDEDVEDQEDNEDEDDEDEDDEDEDVEAPLLKTSRQCQAKQVSSKYTPSITKGKGQEREDAPPTSRVAKGKGREGQGSNTAKNPSPIKRSNPARRKTIDEVGTNSKTNFYS